MLTRDGNKGDNSWICKSDGILFITELMIPRNEFQEKEWRNIFFVKNLWNCKKLYIKYNLI